jgi:hypothetical protein
MGGSGDLACVLGRRPGVRGRRRWGQTLAASRAFCEGDLAGVLGGSAGAVAWLACACRRRGGGDDGEVLRRRRRSASRRWGKDGGWGVVGVDLRSGARKLRRRRLLHVLSSCAGIAEIAAAACGPWGVGAKIAAGSGGERVMAEERLFFFDLHDWVTVCGVSGWFVIQHWSVFGRWIKRNGRFRSSESDSLFFFILV